MRNANLTSFTALVIVNLSTRAYQIGPFLVIEEGEELIATVIETEPDEASQ